MLTPGAAGGPASFATRRSAGLVPAVTGSEESDLVTDRSVEATTAVGSVAESLVPSRSASFPETVAVFDRSAVRAGFTCTVTWTVVLPPEARPPIVQVTVPPDSAPPASAETKEVPAGTGSVMVTPVAAEGPALWATIV